MIASTLDIVRAVLIPVSVDFERGYGSSASSVAAALCRLAESGVASVNLEDGDEPPEVLISKLEASREALRRNVWAAPTLPPLEQLRALGVRRVSVGPRLALTALSAARRDAEQVLAGRRAPTQEGPTLSYAEVHAGSSPRPSTPG